MTSCANCGAPIKLAVQPTTSNLVQATVTSTYSVNLNDATNFARDRLNHGGKEETVIRQLVEWNLDETRAKNIVNGIEEELEHQRKKRWRSSGIDLILVGIVLLVMIEGSLYVFSTSSFPAIVTNLFGYAFWGSIIMMIAGTALISISYLKS